jgi:hypothetical protein
LGQLAPSCNEVYELSLKPPWQSLQSSYVGEANDVLQKKTNSRLINKAIGIF